MRVENVYKPTSSTYSKTKKPQAKSKQQSDKDKADFNEIFKQAKKDIDNRN